MTYKVVTFGTVDLPQIMVADDLGTGEIESTLLASVGGLWDWYGATARRPQRALLAYAGQYQGQPSLLGTETPTLLGSETGVPFLANDGHMALQIQVDSLKALIGVRDKLWRKRDADAVLHWRWARLLDVKHTETISQRTGQLANIVAIFDLYGSGWKPAAPDVDAVANPGAIWSALTVENSGAMDATDAVLTVTRTSGTITGVSVTGPGIEFTWTGTLATGSLVIDAGAQTVRLNGVDAYSGFALGAGHTARGWLDIAPGLGIFQVLATGGAADVSLSHYEVYP